VERALAMDPLDSHSIVVKAHILFHKGLLDETSQLLNEIGREEESLFFSGLRFVDEGDFEAAADVFRNLLLIYPGKPQYLNSAAHSILIAQQRRLSNSGMLPWNIPSVAREALEEAERYLTEAIEILKGQELKRDLTTAYVNRSAARLAL